MCARDGGPGSVAEALRMADASVDYLNSPAAADLPAAACGQALIALGEIQAKVTPRTRRSCAGSTPSTGTTPTGTARHRRGWPR
jgi:hypothetical protein